MKNNSSTNNFLTEIQINELSKYVFEIYGTDLDLDELTESIYLVMENIPGIDLVPNQHIQKAHSQIRNKYYEEIRNKTYSKKY